MSNLDQSDEEFDLRDEVSVEQLTKDETIHEEEQQKVIDHIKACQKKLLEDRPRINKQTLTDDFNNYKKEFSIILANLAEVDNEIDHLTVLLKIAIEKKEYKDMVQHNNKLEKKRVMLKSAINKLNNNIYNKSTTLMANLFEFAN